MPSQAAEPPAPIAAWVKTAGVAPERTGLIALPLDGGPALIQWNARAALNPASTMKLITTHVALSLLGPEHRWVTALHLDGDLRDGVLRGNLVLRGGGDPKLVIEDLTELIGRIRAAGLREIRGDLVIDDGLFALTADQGAPIDGDASQPYNVGPHAALMNFKATRVIVRPVAEQVRISLDPPLADVRLVNELKLINGPCQAVGQTLWIRESTTAAGAGTGTRPAIHVAGRYSPACGEQALFAAVLSHRQFIHGFFKAAWLAAGGVLTGTTRVEPNAARGEPWLRWVSPRTLADVVQDINKFSNNVMTRQVLLGLAARDGVAATPELARERVRIWLEQRGLGDNGLQIDNGSGLSRDERISSQALGRLLVHAAGSTHGDLFRVSLPQVGVDGTMRHRLARHPVSGRAFIKTGSLRDVRSIAGYVDAASGKRYAVVLIFNGEPMLGAQPAQDAFLRWVYENG
jgi:D-alanyl-D-alanine carboxypeptidase/D-alanyl-D-alanine-endopeptidase (penicillin-binding protein 4)